MMIMNQALFARQGDRESRLVARIFTLIVGRLELVRLIPHRKWLAPAHLFTGDEILTTTARARLALCGFITYISRARRGIRAGSSLLTR